MYVPYVKKIGNWQANSTWDLSQCERCVDGIISLEGCQGVPVIMSTPHFLDGDERLWKAIDGLQPVRDLHVTYLNLEPLCTLETGPSPKLWLEEVILGSNYHEILF